MKVKNILPNALIYFVYFFGGCFVTMLTEAIIITITDNVIGLFIPISYFSLTVIRLVIYALGLPALMIFLGYFEGYRDAGKFNISLLETVMSAAVAAIFHSLFAMLFNFGGFVSGGVRFLAGLIREGSAVTPEVVGKTPLLLGVGLFFLFAAVYTACLTVSKQLGAKKRLADRTEMGIDNSKISD